MKLRWTAVLMVLAMSVGLLFTGASVTQASSKGRLNTTYVLGAATIYSLLKGKTTQGLILGAGTAYAYKRANDAHRAERRRSRYDLSRSAYSYPPYTRYHRHRGYAY